MKRRALGIGFMWLLMMAVPGSASAGYVQTISVAPQMMHPPVGSALPSLSSQLERDPYTGFHLPQIPADSTSKVIASIPLTGLAVGEVMRAAYSYEVTNEMEYKTSAGVFTDIVPIMSSMRLVLGATPSATTGTDVSSWNGWWFDGHGSADPERGEHHHIHTDRAVFKVASTDRPYLNLVATARLGNLSGGGCVVRDDGGQGRQKAPPGYPQAPHTPTPCALTAERKNSATMYVERYRTSSTFVPYASPTMRDDEPADGEDLGQNTPLYQSWTGTGLPRSAYGVENGPVYEPQPPIPTQAPIPTFVMSVPVSALPGTYVAADGQVTATIMDALRQPAAQNCAADVSATLWLTQTSMTAWNDRLNWGYMGTTGVLSHVTPSMPTNTASVTGVGFVPDSPPPELFVTLYTQGSQCAPGIYPQRITAGTSIDAHAITSGNWNRAEVANASNGSADVLWGSMSAWGDLLGSSLSGTPVYSAGYGSQHMTLSGSATQASTDLVGANRGAGGNATQYFSSFENHTDFTQAMENIGLTVRHRLWNNGAGSLTQNATTQYGRLGGLWLFNDAP